MKDRWAGMSRVARMGLVAGALIAVIALLAVVSRLGGPSSGGAAPPTSTPSESSSLADDPSGNSTGVPTDGPVASESPSPTTDPGAEALPGLPETGDPDAYATAIAEVVLGLDPRDHERGEYLALLLSEISDEVSDDDRVRIDPVIESWLPDEFQWQRQRDYAQVNEFAAESSWVPDVVRDADEDLPDGYQVRTVAGTQTTEFLDENDELATSSTPRLLTVVMYCPADATCWLVSIPEEVQR